MNLDPKQILEYVKESSGLLTEMQEKVASLEKEKKQLSVKLTAGKKALEEKEASTKEVPVFTEEQVRPVMQKLAKAGKIKDVDAATESIVKDPSGLLLTLDKMAADAITSVPRKLGTLVKTANSTPERESDRQFENTFISLGQKL